MWSVWTMPGSSHTSIISTSEPLEKSGFLSPPFAAFVALGGGSEVARTVTAPSKAELLPLRLLGHSGSTNLKWEAHNAKSNAVE